MGAGLGAFHEAEKVVRWFATDACLCVNSNGLILASNVTIVELFAMAGTLRGESLWDLFETLTCVRDDKRISLDENCNLDDLVSRSCLGLCRKRGGNARTFYTEISVSKVAASLSSASSLFVVIFRDAAAGIEEIHRVQDVITKSSAELTALVDTSKDGVIVIDHNGDIRSFNQAACRMFGYSRKQVIHKNVKMLMPRKYAQHHDRFLGNFYVSGVKKVIGSGREVTGVRADRKMFPIQLNVSEPIIIETCMYFVGVVRDVSNQKAADNEVTSNKPWVEGIVQGKEANVTVDPFGKITYVEAADGALGA
mmetsp:Transcript_15412/g.25436  ORF Transcript_15412/g.25436 Transcript_15412/m.25436 type:complete len:309 (-) Transcript_15412:182-1108(-)